MQFHPYLDGALVETKASFLISVFSLTCISIQSLNITEEFKRNQEVGCGGG